MRLSRPTLFATAAIAAAATTGVALAQTRGLDQRDVAEAQQQHPALLAEFGGAETGARGAYVEASGGGSRQLHRSAGPEPSASRRSTRRSRTPSRRRAAMSTSRAS